VELDLKCFAKFVLVPCIVLARVMVREVGRRDIGDGFGVYSYNLGGNQSVEVQQRSQAIRSSKIPSEHPALTEMI
jgi:hypothetical protein